MHESKEKPREIMSAAMRGKQIRVGDQVIHGVMILVQKMIENRNLLNQRTQRALIAERKGINRALALRWCVSIVARLGIQFQCARLSENQKISTAAYCRQYAGQPHADF